VTWACFALSFWRGPCIICFDIEFGFLFVGFSDCRREMAGTSVKSFKQEHSLGEYCLLLFVSFLLEKLHLALIHNLVFALQRKGSQSLQGSKRNTLIVFL